MRTQEIEKAAATARRNLAQAEADFNATLARNSARWAAEEMAHIERVNQMTNEVEMLEKRKEVALQPTIAREEAADKREKALEIRENQALKREQENEIVAEQLQDKLDEVGEREQDVAHATQRIESQKQGIAEQQEQTRAGVKKLSMAMANFEQYKADTNAKIDERKTVLTLWDNNLVAREAKLIAKDKLLGEVGKKLADERESLQAAWDEFKQLSPPK